MLTHKLILLCTGRVGLLIYIYIRDDRMTSEKLV